MKWLSITTRVQEKIYELWNSKEKLLTLAYHPASGTLRLSADDEKRVFLIGREGFLRRRTVLRNEYGIRIGQLIYDNNQDKQGMIEVYEENFTYTLQNSEDPKASIYRNAELAAASELPAISEDINSDNYDLLILMLCWYLSTTVKKQVEEYA
ncbi:MAG TPA: hypothetical protein VH815_10770 [Acidobacteriota bacterium]